MVVIGRWLVVAIEGWEPAIGGMVLGLPEQIEAHEDAGLAGGHLQEVGHRKGGLLLPLLERPGLEGTVVACGGAPGEAGFFVGVGAMIADEGVKHRDHLLVS